MARNTSSTRTKRGAISSSAKTDETMLKELFIDELKDIYWAEKHLTKALPKMQKAATSEELANAFEEHLNVTEVHVERAEKVFELLDMTARAKKCEAMAGLIKEGEEIMKDTEDGSITRDAGIISAAQKSEHYEIASYGTLRTLAATLGYTEAAGLLEETLKEEKKTDDLLSKIAQSAINPKAKTEKE